MYKFVLLVSELLLDVQKVFKTAIKLQLSLIIIYFTFRTLLAFSTNLRLDEINQKYKIGKKSFIFYSKLRSMPKFLYFTASTGIFIHFFNVRTYSHLLITVVLSSNCLL